MKHPARWALRSPKLFRRLRQVMYLRCLARCALRVRIPMSRDIESLNVAAAAAVCLFERRRRAMAGE